LQVLTVSSIITLETFVLQNIYNDDSFRRIIEVIPKLIQHFPTFSPTAALLLRTTSDSSLFPFVLKLLLFAKSAKGRQESSLGFILTVVPVHPTSLSHSKLILPCCAIKPFKRT